MTGTLRVTPEELMSTANSFSATAGTVQNLTGQMISTIDSLSGIWEGEVQPHIILKLMAFRTALIK